MKKKTKTAYTHPELAKYVEKLFNRHGPSDWKRLFYIIREETVQTVAELVADNKLMYEGALITLPPPPATDGQKNPTGIVTKDKPTKKQHKGGCEKVIRQPAGEKRPKRHEGG